MMARMCILLSSERLRMPLPSAISKVLASSRSVRLVSLRRVLRNLHSVESSTGISSGAMSRKNL